MNAILVSVNFHRQPECTIGPGFSDSLTYRSFWLPSGGLFFTMKNDLLKNMPTLKNYEAIKSHLISCGFEQRGKSYFTLWCIQVKIVDDRGIELSIYDSSADMMLSCFCPVDMIELDENCFAEKG